MDVDRGIRVAVDTGDVTLGSEKSIQSLKLGKGKTLRNSFLHLRRF